MMLIKADGTILRIPTVKREIIPIKIKPQTLNEELLKNYKHFGFAFCSGDISPIQKDFNPF
jgi:hypothetical protein